MKRVYPVYTLHVRIPGPSVHNYYPPPPPVPGAVFPAPDPSCVNAEGAHTLRWVRPGKFTSNVEFDGLPVALEGHDTGAMIAHAAIPLNAGMAITALGSKYKLSFCASTVQANGAPLATFFPVLAPPQFCCVPCSLPAIGTMNSLVPFPNTVGVGMSANDFLAGWVSVIADCVVDLFFTFLFASKDPFEKQLQETMGKSLVHLLFELGANIEKSLREDFIKELAATVHKLLADLRQRGGAIRLGVSGLRLELDAATNTLRGGAEGHPPSFALALGPPDPVDAPPGLTLPPGTPAAL